MHTSEIHVELCTCTTNVHSRNMWRKLKERYHINIHVIVKFVIFKNENFSMAWQFKLKIQQVINIDKICCKRIFKKKSFVMAFFHFTLRHAQIVLLPFRPSDLLWYVFVKTICLLGQFWPWNVEFFLAVFHEGPFRNHFESVLVLFLRLQRIHIVHA